jgi:hypothetical protein
MMKLKDFRRIQELARDEYVRLPAPTRFQGQDRDLRDVERLALAYLHGYLGWLQAQGVKTLAEAVETSGPELIAATSEPDTDDQDWDARDDRS